MAEKTLIIFNPISNLGRSWSVASSLRRVTDEYGGIDWSGTVYPAHATEIAQKAGSAGYTKVIAMGGDGTVHEVINGLMLSPEGERPQFGVVPIGSGNDFAFALGIANDPEKALHQVLQGKPAPVDAALIEDNRGRKEYFVNTIGLGFDAIVTIRSRKVPLLQGFAVYFAAVLQGILLDYRPFHLQMKIDDAPWEETCIMLTMCNGLREGGGFLLDPQASLDDDMFEFVAVKTISPIRMVLSIPYFIKGTHAGLSYVRCGKFRNFHLVSDTPLLIHADGEIFSGLGSDVRELTISMHHNAIQVVR